MKLFEPVHLPVEVNTILSQLYEAYDGRGRRWARRARRSPLGARILAAVDSFLDLTKNPANAHGKRLPKAQALDHLQKHAGVLYDPVVADIVGQVQSGELLRHRIMQDGRQVLIAEPDEATRTDLLESVLQQGLVVHAFSTLEGAQDALAQQRVRRAGGEPAVWNRGRDGGAAGRPGHARVGGLPILVIGEPDASARDRLLMAGASAVVSSSNGRGGERVKRAARGPHPAQRPARVVQGSYDELPQLELLRRWRRGRSRAGSPAAPLAGGLPAPGARPGRVRVLRRPVRSRARCRHC